MQACVLGDPSKPLTQTQYTEAQERAASVVQLGEVLPQVYGIVDCRFIDNAFNVIIADECSGLDDNSLGLAAAAFISAISLTLTTFYFCICIQCAPDPAPRLHPSIPIPYRHASTLPAFCACSTKSVANNRLLVRWHPVIQSADDRQSAGHERGRRMR